MAPTEGSAFFIRGKCENCSSMCVIPDCLQHKQSPESAANAARVTRRAGSPTEHQSGQITGAVM